MPLGTAIVTGAAAGLGRVIARTLGPRGAHVVIADRDAMAGRGLRDELRESGREATFVETDGSPEYAAPKAGLIRFTTAVADFSVRY
jgi:NAD(P)-dependent dehydrogenase (short-subunit alcohol dehydrogenase family)